MFRGVLKCTSSKNLIIITGIHKKFRPSILNSVFQHQSNRVPAVHLYYSQKRFNSSEASGNSLHKVFFVRADSPPSSEETNVAPDAIEYIPPPPAPPSSELTEQDVVLNALGEPTFESLGLGGWSPVGLAQNALEFLHVSCDLPWWGSIAVVTVVIRTVLFPLVIKVQRNNTNFTKYMPLVKSYQERISEARASGNQLEAAKAAYEMQTLMKEKGLNPLKTAFMPLIQAPIFISMFLALRRCANLPVESMKEGGYSWFIDLTASDPYYALPIITCTTMIATIKVGTDGQPMSAEATAKLVKYLLPALPIIIFPFTCHFPAAILWYWVCTNLFSLVQVGILRIPVVRDYFAIGKIVKQEKKKGKGFIADVKESFSNMKAVSKIEDLQKLDARNFEQAGRSPLVKTYKHNPLTEIKAKPRDH